MTIISNSFAPACRQLLPKYTISTLRSIDIVDNQKDYGCILKFSRFQNVKKVRPINAFLCVDKPPPIFSKISVRRLACAKLQINRDIITRILKNNTPALQTPS